MKISAFLPVILHLSVFLVIQIAFNFIQDLQLITKETGNKIQNSKRFKLSSIERVSKGSSVWCTGSNKTDRVCKFRNLCYHPIYQEYIFFHGNKSIMDGITQDRFDPALLDMSSVDDHNTQYFNFVDFPASSLYSFPNLTVYDGISFIFHRFNSENIMHVIHDDLLPLFHTMKQYTNPDPNQPIDLTVRLVFMEGWEKGPYFELYELFSNQNPLLKHDIIQNNSLKCFQHAVVGISKFTTWYQYGFKVPQGPLPKIQISSSEVREFTAFIKHRLNILEQNDQDIDDDYMVFCSRKYNRLVLNEAEISLAMAEKLNMRVVQVSMETHSLIQLIQIISKASALVGMHGSALVMAMFLPPGAMVVEMFPFAINPKNYQPYKTLAELPGMNLVYSSWRNTLQENSVTHPYDSPETGGIIHLSKDEQELVKNTLEVPPHLCCSNSFWLYRIYQDTLVDKDSFLEVVVNTYHVRQEYFTKGFDSNPPVLFPSKVLNITCSGSSNSERKPALYVSWKKPINVVYFNTSVKYEVWIQMADEDDYMAYILPFTEYVFTDGLKTNTRYRIWVRCLTGNVLGSFGTSTSCST